MAKRRELEQTSFLYGGNSSFIEELYARYLTDPAGVDPSWRAYFDELEPENRALFERARAALKPQPARLRLVQPAAAPAAAGDLDENATKALIRDHLRVIMLIRAYRVRGHLIAKLDPLGLTHNAAAPRARLPHLRLHRRRSRPRILPRLRAGPGEGHAAPDHGGPAGDLQRHGRHRVHAHPGPGAEGLDPVADRGHGRHLHHHGRGEARDPRAPHRDRGLRAVPPRQVPGHQALRARRRREHHPRAGDDHPHRRRARRRGDRDRHAASRPAQRAGQRDGQALRGDPVRVPGRGRHRRRAGLGRRQVPSGHLDRPGAAQRQAHPPVA